MEEKEFIILKNLLYILRADNILSIPYNTFTKYFDFALLEFVGSLVLCKRLVALWSTEECEAKGVTPRDDI